MSVASNTVRLYRSCGSRSARARGTSFPSGADRVHSMNERLFEPSAAGKVVGAEGVSGGVHSRFRQSPAARPRCWRASLRDGIGTPGFNSRLPDPFRQSQ